MVENNMFADRDFNSLSELYHTNTKLNRWNARKYGERVEIFNISYQNLISVFHKPGKSYSWAPSISLPLNLEKGELTLEETIAGRRSAKEFTGKSISKEQLSFILRFSAGITDEMSSLHAYPSAGAMYPLELYIVAFAVTDIENGLFHYSVHEHSLRKLASGDFRDKFSEVLFAENLIETSSAAIIISAIFHRNQIKYGERGYRMILLESGHLGQNILLSATSQRIAAVPIGGFLDDELNGILGLDGIEEAVIYPLLLGIP